MTDKTILKERGLSQMRRLSVEASRLAVPFGPSRLLAQGQESNAAAVTREAAEGFEQLDHAPLAAALVCR
jgi:hypothetical protein